MRFSRTGAGRMARLVSVCVGTNGISVMEHAYNYLPSMLSYTNSINGWVHVAVVYSNKQPVLYVNGVNVRTGITSSPVSYTHLRAHETRHDLVCRLLLDK